MLDWFGAMDLSEAIPATGFTVGTAEPAIVLPSKPITAAFPGALERQGAESF
jgi:hypothetical protein